MKYRRIFGILCPGQIFTILPPHPEQKYISLTRGMVTI